MTSLAPTPDYFEVLPDAFMHKPVTFYHLLTGKSGVPDLSGVGAGNKPKLAGRLRASVMHSSDTFGIWGDVMT